MEVRRGAKYTIKPTVSKIEKILLNPILLKTSKYQSITSLRGYTNDEKDK